MSYGGTLNLFASIPGPLILTLDPSVKQFLDGQSVAHMLYPEVQAAQLFL